MKKILLVFFILFILSMTALASQTFITYVKVDEAYLAADDFKTVIGILYKGAKVQIIDANKNKLKVIILDPKGEDVKKGDIGWVWVNDLEITSKIKKGLRISEEGFVTIGKVSKDQIFYPQKTPIFKKSPTPSTRIKKIGSPKETEAPYIPTNLDNAFYYVLDKYLEKMKNPLAFSAARFYEIMGEAFRKNDLPLEVKKFFEGKIRIYLAVPKVEGVIGNKERYAGGDKYINLLFGAIIEGSEIKGLIYRTKSARFYGTVLDRIVKAGFELIADKKHNEIIIIKDFKIALFRGVDSEGIWMAFISDVNDVKKAKKYIDLFYKYYKRRFSI